MNASSRLTKVLILCALAGAAGCDGSTEIAPRPAPAASAPPDVPPEPPAPEPASCTDGLQNADEQGVDCGGASCAPCGSCAGGAECIGDLLWSQSAGGEAAWSVSPVSIATDPQGNVVVGGRFGGTVDFGAGPLACATYECLFVASFDGEGHPRWGALIDTDGYTDGPVGLATDADGNVFVAGDFMESVTFPGEPTIPKAGERDVFLAKYDAGGQLLWNRHFSSAPSFVSVADLATDGEGNVLLTGGFAGPLDLGGGVYSPDSGVEIYLAKLDPDGEHVWSRHFGSTWSVSARSLAVDGEGSAIVCGRLGGTADFGGGPLGSSDLPQFYVLKLDDAGDHVWSERFQADGYTADCTHVATDGAGDVLVGGYFDGTLDLGGEPLTSTDPYSDELVARLDAAGKPIWGRSYGATESSTLEGLAADGAGSALFSGRFQGAMDVGAGPMSGPGLESVFLAKLDDAGEHAWSWHIESDSAVVALARVAVDFQGNVFVVMRFSGVVDLGDGPHDGGEHGKMLLVKLTP